MEEETRRPLLDSWNEYKDEQKRTMDRTDLTHQSSQPSTSGYRHCWVPIHTGHAHNPVKEVDNYQHEKVVENRANP